MKKLAILLILINTIAQAQSYKFDLMTNYSQKIGPDVIDRLVYSDSNSAKYFLVVGSFLGLPETFLIDFEKSVVHKFEAVETKENGEIFFTFLYLKTEPIKKPKEFLKHDFTIEEIKSDSISKTVKVTIYSDSRKMKAVTSQTIEMKKSDANLFPLYRVSCLHPFEIMSQLTVPENYTVISGEGLTYGGFKTETKLQLIKKVQFELNVPD